MLGTQLIIQAANVVVGLFTVMIFFVIHIICGTENDVVVNVTTPGGGDTTNIDTLEFEVTGYGAPTFTPAPTPGA